MEIEEEKGGALGLSFHVVKHTERQIKREGEKVARKM